MIGVPVFFGYILLQGDDDPSASESLIVGSAATGMAGDDMGGGAMGGGDAAGATVTIQPGTAQAPGGAPTAVLPDGVRAFAEIQATDIVIEPDPSGAGAVLRVETSIDVACAVAFGPAADFGSLATDTDMAGGGHSNHHPLMRGLVADTTYFYVLSAIGPDGSLYQSQKMQFTYTGGAAPAAVPPVPSLQPPAPNVADLATVTDVSSEYSASFVGANAMDGSLSTEWSSAGDGDGAYIVLDFGELMLIEGVGFRTREMSDGTSITTSFTATVDGKVYGPFPAGPGLSVALLQATGETVRIDVETSTGGNTGAVEIEVYGESER